VPVPGARTSAPYPPSRPCSLVASPHRRESTVRRFCDPNYLSVTSVIAGDSYIAEYAPAGCVASGSRDGNAATDMDCSCQPRRRRRARPRRSARGASTRPASLGPSAAPTPGDSERRDDHQPTASAVTVRRARRSRWRVLLDLARTQLALRDAGPMPLRLRTCPCCPELLG
jgi:hypothetical protein